MNMTRSAGSRARRTGTLAAFAAAIIGVASIQPASAQSNPSGWQYEFTPYLWTTGLNGEVKTPTVPAAKVDMSFGDIFDTLDFALSGAFEARNGKWGLLVDAQYYRLSEGGSVTGAGPAGGTLDANLRIKQTLLAGAGAYRVLEGTSPVDLVGGLRYTKLDVEVNSDFAAGGLGTSGSRRGNKDWVDPYIGVRLKHPLSDRWSMVGYADVGGFGVGSDFTWQAQAGLEYRVSDKYAVKFGYRILDVDYDKDGFVYNMKTDGLYVGVGIRF